MWENRSKGILSVFPTKLAKVFWLTWGEGNRPVKDCVIRRYSCVKGRDSVQNKSCSSSVQRQTQESRYRKEHDRKVLKGQKPVRESLLGNDKCWEEDFSDVRRGYRAREQHPNRAWSDRCWNLLRLHWWKWVWKNKAWGFRESHVWRIIERHILG